MAAILDLWCPIHPDYGFPPHHNSKIAEGLGGHARASVTKVRWWVPRAPRTRAISALV